MIICEIGQNWMGDPALARYLINEARINGADLVKFQLYDHQMLYKDNPEIPDVALTFDQAKAFFDFGKENGIEVFFSVFDVERVKWCEKIGVKRYKIAYGERKNIELLYSIPGNKELIISSDTPYWGDKTLYCVSCYPAEVKDYKVLKSFDGISDHTIGIDLAKIGLTNSMIVEKHFCLNHHTGIDAEWSMDSRELKELKRWNLICQSIL